MIFTLFLTSSTGPAMKHKSETGPNCGPVPKAPALKQRTLAILGHVVLPPTNVGCVQLRTRFNDVDVGGVRPHLKDYFVRRSSSVHAYSALPCTIRERERVDLRRERSRWSHQRTREWNERRRRWEPKDRRWSTR